MSALPFFRLSICSLDRWSLSLVSASAQALNTPIVSCYYLASFYLDTDLFSLPVYAEKAEAEKSLDAMKFNCAQRTSLLHIS